MSRTRIISIIIAVGIVLIALGLVLYRTVHPTNLKPITYTHIETGGRMQQLPQIQDTQRNTTTQDSAQQQNNTADTLTHWENSGNIKQDLDAWRRTAVHDTGAQHTQYNTNPTIQDRQDAPPAEPPALSDDIDVDAWLSLWGSGTSTIPHTQAPTETPEQQAIRAYANTYGEKLKNFSIIAGQQAQDLDVYAQDRADAAAQARVRALANKYRTLSAQLLSIQTTAPDAVHEAGRALARAYRSVGDATEALITDDTDKDFLTQVYAYNAVIDNFAQAFSAFSASIISRGVHFNTGESGDIFVPMNMQ